MKLDHESIVVIPWDFSQHANRALEFVVDEVPIENVRVICVLETPGPYTPDFVMPYEAEDKAIAKCEKKFQEEIEQGKYPGLQFIAVFGDPASEVVRFAKQFDASMIVMSTHGRGGLNRLVMGSVTEKVLRSAKCPVLILPNALVPAG